MKQRTHDVIATIMLFLFICFWLWPWVLGVVDIAAWTMTGTQFTKMPWSSVRGSVAMIWPIVIGALISMWNQ